MAGQTAFSDIEGASRRRVTKRDEFPRQMDAATPPGRRSKVEHAFLVARRQDRCARKRPKPLRRGDPGPGGRAPSGVSGASRPEKPTAGLRCEA